MSEILLHIKNHNRQPADGVTTFIDNLSTHLSNRFERISIYPDNYRTGRINGSPYSIRAFLTLLLAVLREKANLIVIAHTFPMIFYISIIRIFLRKKIRSLIVVEHRSTTNRRKLIFLPFDYFIYSAADKVVSVSSSAERNLLKWLDQVPRLGSRIQQKSHVIFNGVQRCRVSARVQYVFRRLVFIGRLHRDKNPMLLVEIGRLKLKLIEEILIIGTGEMEESLRANVSQYDGTPISFHGELTEPFLKIPDDSIVVVPSITEGFGLVAAEAMMNEFPLVCSNIAALEEITYDGDLCWLAKSGDPESFAAAIRAILANPLATEQKIRRASKIISSRFNWTETAEKYLAVIATN